MKAKFYFTILACLAALIVIPTSCDKEVESSERLTPLQPANLDEDAATWTNILLATPDQIAVPAPKDETDPTYLAELASIKDIQSKLTNGQRDAIEYWSGGGVLRWNQFFRELVAQYNLPPAPKADGTYPAPDAENPFADPGFPFSNPPYASRAYSYVSASVYDALKSAWHYKYLYDRDAPYKVDSGIKALMPETDLPAYPSEEAVMSGAAAEMLKLLFPAALEKITLKAAEQRNAALWSGKAAPSDISAGLALGKSVAALFITRARGDGMGAAIGTKAQWDALATNATSRGDVAWQSLETPPRPPMLPFFSNVKPWIMTPTYIADNIRPEAPPIRGSAEMNTEIEEVKYYTTHLTRERLAIVHKWADGVNTYTPPGHWNDIAAEHIRDANYSEVRAARAFALLNMTMHNAALACWDAKYFYFNARPSQLDPSIKTGTGIPNFPAYVSGHSTFSASAATFLSYLFPEHEGEFHSMAEEAAMSRLYGGIHYRKDCMVGLDVGNDVGEFTVENFAKIDGAD
ncbi:MAG TPA: phosphatase PAP2 family protein [Chryseolinea sp.]|nr:phosphatase PAP2 family protein [Chryseolinea sp.]